MEAVPFEPLGWVARRDTISCVVVAMREEGYLEVEYPGDERVVELPDGSRMTLGRGPSGIGRLGCLQFCCLLAVCTYHDVRLVAQHLVLWVDESIDGWENRRARA